MKTLSNVVKHPVFITFFGFILTGILGVMFSNNYERIQTENELKKESIEKRKELVKQFSELLYNRYTQSQILYITLMRNGPTDELKQQKKNYDAVYAEWQSKNQIYLLSIRELLSAPLFEKFHFKLKGVVESLYYADSCIVKAYDLYINGENLSDTVLAKCDVSDMLEQIYSCLYSTTNDLYKLTAIELPNADSTCINKWFEDTILTKDCPSIY